MSHVALTTRFLPTLNSDGPLSRARSHQGFVTTDSWNVSPAALPDVSSRLLAHVNAIWACKPWDMRFTRLTCKESYHDWVWYSVVYMPPVLGLSSRAVFSWAVRLLAPAHSYTTLFAVPGVLQFPVVIARGPPGVLGKFCPCSTGPPAAVPFPSSLGRHPGQ